MRPREWSTYLSKRFRISLLFAQNAVRIVAGKKEIAISSGDADDELHGLDVDGNWIDVLRRIRDSSRLAAQNFMPKPHDGELIVFSSKQRVDRPYRDEMLGWRPLALGGVKACEIEADHDSILRGPAVCAIAEILDRALREVQHSSEQCVRIQETTEVPVALQNSDLS